MKRSNPRIGIIVLFASLLMMFNAYPVISHAALVEFNILNAPTNGVIYVCQGDFVEVEFAADPRVIGENDTVQLRNAIDEVVSEVRTHGEITGKVDLDTSQDNALGELAIVYVTGEGGVLSTADDSVNVVSEYICRLINVAGELKVQATCSHRRDYIDEFIIMLQAYQSVAWDFGDRNVQALYNNIVWSLYHIAEDVIDVTQQEQTVSLSDKLDFLSPYGYGGYGDYTRHQTTLNDGKGIAFLSLLTKIHKDLHQLGPPIYADPEIIIINSIPELLHRINAVSRIHANRLLYVISKASPPIPIALPLGYEALPPLDPRDELPNILDDYMRYTAQISTSVGIITEHLEGILDGPPYTIKVIDEEMYKLIRAIRNLYSILDDK